MQGQITTKIPVAIWGEPTSLNIFLLENLLSKICYVEIFSSEISTWNDLTTQLNKDKSFTFSNESHFFSSSFPYVVLDVGSFIKTENFDKYLDLFYRAVIKNSSKVLLVSPFVVSERESILVKKTISYFSNYDLSKVIYVGETYGPRMQSGESFVADLFFKFLTQKEVFIDREEVSLYPAYVPALAKKLVNELFSFGVSSLSLLYFSQYIKEQDLANLLSAKTGKPYINKNKLSYDRVFFKVDKRFILEGNIDDSVEETLSFFKDKSMVFKEVVVEKPLPKKPEVVPEKKPINKPVLPKLTPPDIRIDKILWTLGLSLLLLFLIPAFLIGISYLFLGIGLKEVQSSNLKVANLALSLSKSAVYLPNKFLLATYDVPILGSLLTTERKFGNFSSSLGNVGNEGVGILESLSMVFSNVAKKQDFPLAPASDGLVIKLDTLYKDMSFLKAEVDADLDLKSMFGKYFDSYEISDARNKLLFAKDIVGQLPELLGSEKPQTYMILFQNNTELRPTGGFVGSFALITFNKGKLQGFEVHDVYEADGQLRGHVDPPDPIKDYLGEAGWFLRDANWDPDFSTSASKIEWFLDKELGKHVDGVVSLDLNVVASLLNVVGPINLPDFNKQITSKNLYSETQNEVESNFFPGTYKKRNFLTALSQSLIAKLVDSGEGQYFGLGRELYKNLQQKHIQIFLHNNKANTGIALMGFGGGRLNLSCGIKNCFADTIGINEANLGVNKVNYYVDRKMSLVVDLTSENINRNLTVAYTNHGKDVYKNYIRLPISEKSKIVNVSEDGVQRTDFDFSQEGSGNTLGILTLVQPESTKTLSFSWQEPLLLDISKGAYQLYWVKQAGTLEDPVALELNSPVNSVLDFASNKGVFLTRRTKSYYNTTLEKDLIARFSW